MSLIQRLPEVRGRYSENASMAKITWFKVGGPAEVMFRPADADDLAHFLAQRPKDVPVTVIGVGSNLLVRDGGLPGVAVRLGREFAFIECLGTRIRVGAAALDINVAIAAQAGGIKGLEFLAGIPGTIGGALRMNAGAFGSEIKDVTLGARALDQAGHFHDMDVADMSLGYRRSGVEESWIFTEALLEGRPGDPEEIAGRIAEIRREREANQPQREATGGSTFANPPGESAWKLIDQAGCRGLRRGGAMVSEKHCNFLVNTGNATAADIEELGEEVRRRVFEATNITLEWEIRRIGVPVGKEAKP